MAKRVEENMGPEALAAATGRDYVQWRQILLDAGAREWSHAPIARFLVDEHGVSPWWAQGITVDFEQTVQGRQPGQRADGTFSTQKARTIPGNQLEALATVTAALIVEYGEPASQNLTAKLPTVRFSLPDGTKLHAQAGAEKASGTPITVTQEKIATAESAAAAKGRFTAILMAL